MKHLDAFPIVIPALTVVAVAACGDMTRPEVEALIQPAQLTVTGIMGNGSKMAFHSLRDGNIDVYVMNADGSAQARLTDNPGFDGQPSWSPDGRQIAFTSLNLDGAAQIFIMNADGSGQTNLSNRPAVEQFPRWSPDGRKIVFQSRRAGNTDIYVMNADGSDQTRLTVNPAFDGRPDWSPDGGQIAFQSGRDGPLNSEVYVMNADGSDQANLTNNPGAGGFTGLDGSPRWSPISR